mmetsp:Transcript_36674/g.80121  ORF Transcript_36674/g.80121 Transcript_36674/m.80121 type:complete len:323 (+) Transcript_36674:474-1442(+)
MCRDLGLLQQLAVLAVVVLQHLDGHLHGLDSGLVVSSRLSVLLVFLTALLVHLGLRLVQSSQLRLQRGDLLGSFRDGGLSLVDLGLQLGNHSLVVLLLRSGLLGLLGAPLVLLGISLGFLGQLVQHVTDQTLDLGEHILLGRSTGCDLSEHHGQRHVLLVATQLSQRSQSAVDRVILGPGGCRQLQKTVRSTSCSSGLLLNYLLGCGQRLQLILAIRNTRLVIRGLLHTVGLDLSQRVAVRGCILLRLLKIRLRVSLQLAMASQLAASTGDLLVLRLQLIGQGLLQHVEVELSFGLSLLAVSALALSFFEQIAQQIQNGSGS